MQSGSDLSAAFSELGRLEPVQKPNKAMLDWRDKAFAPGPDSEVLVEHTHSGVDVARKDIRTLRTRQWLNDEVMNVYMGLLQVWPACVLHCIAPLESSPSRVKLPTKRACKLSQSWHACSCLQASKQACLNSAVLQQVAVYVLCMLRCDIPSVFSRGGHNMLCNWMFTFVYVHLSLSWKLRHQPMHLPTMACPIRLCLCCISGARCEDAQA